MSNIFDLFKKIEKKDDSGNTSSAPEWLVVGLGNPGDQYARTRHNIGFMSVDYLSQSMNIPVKKFKFNALVGDGVIGGKRVLLVKPQTMMNASGDAVGETAKFYKIPAERILIVYDDINLDVGRLRIRGKGSDGGHNGIKSIIASLGSQDFPRIKVGVGQKPHPDYDLADWVLGEIPANDRKLLFEVFAMVKAGAETVITGNMEEAMQLCNGFTANADITK